MFLGVDTSAYTTSMALVDTHGECLREQRAVLPVQAGSRGLRQGEAVFEHVRALGGLCGKLFANKPEIRAICASDRPRNVEGSYMPVFRVGEAWGQSLGAALGVPFYTCSHQEGHLMAAWWQHRDCQGGPFLAFHISGGTTELLRVAQGQGRFSAKIVGRALDLHAGQLVDRIGVALGLPFPCGKHLEALAVRNTRSLLPLKTHVVGTDMSLSGLERQAMKALAEQVAPECVAASIYAALSRTFVNAISGVQETAEEARTVLMMGGVSSSVLLRSLLEERAVKRCRAFKLYYGDPNLCSDNAVGVARMAQTMYYNR